MSVTLCRCCQLELLFGSQEELRTCPACGTINARPKADGPALDSLRRATAQRLSCDFSNAEISYQHVLLDYPEEHEALWGRLLCRYGIEYVDDPRTGKRKPVVHTVRPKPMQEEGDFRAACQFAPEEVRAQYEAEAEYIDTAMLCIRQLANSSQPYDVFICHKTTTLKGDGFTRDYTRALDLYYLLTAKGLRVFFAPKELESVAAGENYEAGIYHALITAKTMLVICSDPAHLNSPWVRNEWQRFIELADETPDKRVIPLLYGDMEAGDLPREFRARGLQAMLMHEMGAQEKLVQALTPAAPKTTSAPAVPAMVDTSRHASIHKLLDAACWDAAQQEVTACLQANPGDAQAHLYQLLIEMKLRNEKDLARCTRPLESLESWHRFVEHADAATYDRIMAHRKAAERRRVGNALLLSLLAIPVTFGLLVLFTLALVYLEEALETMADPHYLVIAAIFGLLFFCFFRLRKRKTLFIGSCLAFAFLCMAVFMLLTYVSRALITFSIHYAWGFVIAGVPVLLAALRVFLRKPT